MLEEKLQQASQASARVRQRALWAFIGVGLLAVVVIMLFFFQSAPSPTAAIQTKSADAVRSREPTSDQSELRNRFMAHLQIYQNGQEADLAGANLLQWHAQQAEALTALKQDAIAAFSAGDYTAALEKLDALVAMARQTLATRDALLAGEIAAVKQALGADDAVAATLHITKALQLKPNNLQLQPLAQQAQALPALLTLLKKAGIAHTENNPEQELAWLNQAVNIAAHRNGLKPRRDALAQRIRETQFSRLISAGLAAVENKDMRTAQRNYKAASALLPKRSELNTLHAAINKLSDMLALQRALTQAGSASARDDWPKAQTVYAEVARRFPDNRDIHDGLQLADKVVSLQASIRTYLGQAERLSARNVFTAAQNTLIQARVFTRNSPSLARNTEKLQALLISMDKKIPVLVKSDNQTFIRVRGVGKVGITLARTIQLKPGIYTFEGIRAGYKSKLVRVRLPAGMQSFEVDVVCDEPI